MAQIHDGGGMMFDALAYGQPHVSTQQFLVNQFDNLSATLQNAGQAFIDSAQRAYDAISGSQAMRVLRAAGRAVRSAWQLDEIRPLFTIGELQHAPMTMQRWLMAEPTARALYHQQKIDGYSDTYIDMHPGDIGERHYDYRRAMDGLLVVDESSEDGDWHAMQYPDELLPNDAELELDQQIDIQQAWAFLQAKIADHGDDPTSRYNAAM